MCCKNSDSTEKVLGSTWWGGGPSCCRLHGGTDFGTPLLIQKVGRLSIVFSGHRAACLLSPIPFLGLPQASPAPIFYSELVFSASMRLLSCLLSYLRPTYSSWPVFWYESFLHMSPALHNKLHLDLFPSSLLPWLATIFICAPVRLMTCVPTCFAIVF
jgi:hypothetical protein